MLALVLLPLGGVVGHQIYCICSYSGGQAALRPVLAQLDRGNQVVLGNVLDNAVAVSLCNRLLANSQAFRPCAARFRLAARSGRVRRLLRHLLSTAHRRCPRCPAPSPWPRYRTARWRETAAWGSRWNAYSAMIFMSFATPIPSSWRPSSRLSPSSVRALRASARCPLRSR